MANSLLPFATSPVLIGIDQMLSAGRQMPFLRSPMQPDNVPMQPGHVPMLFATGKMLVCYSPMLPGPLPMPEAGVELIKVSLKPAHRRPILTQMMC
jgi:hypothetical protein